MLRDHGHEVNVCLFDGVETNFTKSLRENGINIISFSKDCNVYNPLFIIKLARLMRKYDIVHTHNTACQLFAAIGSYFCKAKCVTTEHSTSTRRRNYPIFRPIDKWMYTRYKGIICISEPSQANLCEYIGDHYPIQVIKNGVNVRKFFDATPIDLGIGDCKKITMVAGFRYEKDQPTVIKALNYLPGDYHVVLVGDGVERDNLEKLVDSLELRERVHFLGLRNDVPNILKSSDVVVMSSHREGLSLSNVEGMCSGHPFVASDVEGLREVTKGYGLLFPHGDSKALADIIMKLCTDASYAKEVSDRCKERAMEYDIQKMVDGYEQVYESIG